ncbi:MAG: hypothetical protein KJ787_00380 [Gammaproteobacteria bacterium]|nr:hypothetical protein [Gammaproteobacteria bacterium]MBU1644773.1 hypothetical protein [Gammaproteobacteria bacterium]MBU1973507.1 hypothetical protein [Gammaproteobacteria bacterium]
MQLPESGLVTAALVILACTVAAGAATAYFRLADKNTPFDIGLLHGGAGVSATVLLLVAILTGNGAEPNTRPALGLLALTIGGGVTLYYLIRRKGLLPRSVVFMHGGLALAAVYTLLFGPPF